KTPLLIAAMATAVTLTTFLPANAKVYWASAEAESTQLIDANFKVKIKKSKTFKHHKGFHTHKPRAVVRFHSNRPKHSVKKKLVTRHSVEKKIVTDQGIKKKIVKKHPGSKWIIVK
ncbi:MAG: hypothetical protein AAF194_05505, partial [Pseudomonadota bacterium]